MLKLFSAIFASTLAEKSSKPLQDTQNFVLQSYLEISQLFVISTPNSALKYVHVYGNFFLYENWSKTVKKNPSEQSLKIFYKIKICYKYDQ